jgi:hypothetical protein
MKNTIFLAVLTTWLVACAQNEMNQSVETADGTSASDSSMPAPKKQVCTDKRNNSAGSRLQRVCR